MARLSQQLKYFLAKKVSEDADWRGVEIVLSGHEVRRVLLAPEACSRSGRRADVLPSRAQVPGEGEHKIMDFIRRQRVHPSHDPNTKHVIYGLDADLIMLSLATHEPHFKVLREDVFADDKKKKGGGCHRCGQPGHHSSQCTGASLSLSLPEHNVELSRVL